ncbi:simple sugar transport system permease protein [Brachybacterium muris]|uniref:ABC transporter permease n=1 Tax=Brachybacterium muris TaxID=219301 RepID=UPI001957FAEB|nr:ABC transporter permease [Brachybacterium muris]MBM7502446.1 simple sugar transport system permease protein [Brachybacterium muris]MCT1429405.1 ABC transporter permease [Brachybacterium muris]
MNEARLGPRAQVILMVALVVVLAVSLSLMAPDTFPTLRNAQSMMGQIAPLGILALCIGLTFLIGGIDLSVVAVANTAAITAALVGTALEPSLGGAGASAVGVLAALVIGLIAGSLNGYLVSTLRVHPIPITLGTMSVYMGISTGLTQGATVYGTGDLGALSVMAVAMMPLSFVIFLLLVVVFAVITMKTRLGFQMYSVGESAKVARFARLPVDRITMLVYCCSGTLAAVAGLLMFSSTNAANVSFAGSYLMQAILIAVVAGIDPYGGAGRMWMIIIGALAMQELQTGINLALGTWSGSSFAANFVWGVLLIAVLGLSKWMSTRKRRVRKETVEAELAPA